MADANTPATVRHGGAVPTTGEEPTIGKLVKDLTSDLQKLVQQMIALVKSEVKVSLTISGVGLGLLAGAAFFGLLSLVLLSGGFVWLLSMTGLHLAWCFLIVFAVYLLVAGLLALIGVKKLKSVRPPERTIKQARETKAVLKH